MRKRIAFWISKQLKAAGAKGIVLGLSGGLDSCVVAALAKEAAGRERLLALILPCYSHREDLLDARFFAREFGIRTKTIDLSKIYAGLLKILPAANKLAAVNLKPRLRMAVLYYFANKLNYLVCGTGNRSEISTGYFTKYGDGAADILPIGDLLKKQVRALAVELKIPRRIIERIPTAGLWPGQTDEGEMGITYAELDDILKRLAGKKKQIAQAFRVNRVKAMVAGSAHKRQGPKICYL